jgi:hypothetical protein
VLSNWNAVFGGEFWLFWWPTEVSSENDFTEFPMRPPVGGGQVSMLGKEIREKLEGNTLKNIPMSIEELRKQEECNYEGVIFYYLNKPYQLVK